MFALTFGEHTTKPTFKLVFQLTGTHMRVTQAALQRKAERAPITGLRQRAASV